MKLKDFIFPMPVLPGLNTKKKMQDLSKRVDAIETSSVLKIAIAEYRKIHNIQK